MAMFGIDGLASGLDTTSLINQLMQVEAMPQTLLKTKQSTAQTFVSGLQALNTRVASLAEAAQKAAKPASWQAYSGTSSSDAATAKVGANAQAGNVSFTVTSVAATQSSLLTMPATYTSATPSFTITRGTGETAETTTITADSTSIADIAKAVNSSGSGVNASVINVGTSAAPEYRLQLTGAQTGAANSFTITSEDSAAQPGVTQIRAASDASIMLFPGTDAAVAVTSDSNTFTGLMSGVDVTVSKVTGPTDDPVTVTVARDDAALTKLASGIVGSLGVVLSEISSKTAISTTTGSDGKATVKGGIFTGDSAIRGIQNQLTTAMSMPVGGTSPAEVGIILGRDGTVTFDEEKFAAALAADPAKVQSMITQLADRVATAATGISDKYDGTLTKKIEGQQGQVRDMGNQIESWDRRLDNRRSGLERTYAALEVRLSGLQSQSSWLASQLASLPSYSNR
ncbi:flagellar filament capping protein FliD [Actinotalea sp. C106]|uniref:flagellar filament capping protein FliD n=1 Tax=Actinotalea sp. C106 TaxID=2908644 RepID=UPI002027734E|nr:flagellar filament capping protein FliD [Actinotalea sp. C106]